MVEDSKLQILTPNPLFGKYLYPDANDFREQQQDIGWTAQEIKVEKDIQDYRQNMSPEQYNLVTITLQLFVEIEQKVGDVWEQFAKTFPHSEIDGACVTIAAMEKGVHAFFYQKMSDVLNIEPEVIAANQEQIKQINNKLSFLNDITKDLQSDKALALATVAMIEQILLFSNFAMLKSFRSNGVNLISSTVSGVDFVVNDEIIHGEFAAYLYANYIMEYQETYKQDFPLSNDRITDRIELIIEHEDEMIDYAFPDGPINGIVAKDLKIFIRSRANHVLEQLHIKPLYDVTECKISEWFYKGINSIKSHDFFVTGTNSYKRTWSFDGFSRLPHMKEK